MTHPLEDAMLTLAELRAFEGAGPLSEDGTILPGAFLAMDRQQGEMGASFASAPGVLLDLQVTVTRPGRWLALNFALGNRDLSGLEVLGLWCRLRAPQVVTAKLAVRTGLGEGFEDAAFTRHLVAFPDSATHVDVLQLADFPVLWAEASWRNLMLTFETKSFALTIEDLRIFAA